MDVEAIKIPRVPLPRSSFRKSAGNIREIEIRHQKPLWEVNKTCETYLQNMQLEYERLLTWLTARLPQAGALLLRAVLPPALLATSMSTKQGYTIVPESCVHSKENHVFE